MSTTTTPPEDATNQVLRLTALVRSPSGTFGAGYLIAPTLVVTCAHVIGNVAENAPVDVAFEMLSRTVRALVIERDDAVDAALLRLDDAVTDVAPLPFAESITPRAEFVAAGCPDLTGGHVLPLTGSILTVAGVDDRGESALVLYSEQIKDARPHGFSGGPVVVNGQVAGHLRRIVVDPTSTRPDAQMGVLYATPVAEIVSLVRKHAPVARVVPPPVVTGAYREAWYVRRIKAEQKAHAALENEGSPVMLLGPEQSGKTWLMQHILADYRKRAGWFVVRVDLDEIDRDARRSYDTFSRTLGKLVLRQAREVGLAPRKLADLLDDEDVGNAVLTKVLQHILRERSENLLLAMDRVEVVWKSSYEADFHGLLRARALQDYSPWPRLRLMFALSTTALLHGETSISSLANISERVELGGFNDDEVQALEKIYGLAWTAAERAAVNDLLGGHPYLVRLLMHECQSRPATVTDLLAPSSDVFEGHLELCRLRLRAYEDLRQRFVQIRAGAHELAPDDGLVRLEMAGFIRWDQHSARLRYKLLERLEV